MFVMKLNQLLFSSELEGLNAAAHCFACTPYLFLQFDT